jgi:hypothetical protein
MRRKRGIKFKYGILRINFWRWKEEILEIIILLVKIE